MAAYGASPPGVLTSIGSSVVLLRPDSRCDSSPGSGKPFSQLKDLS